MSETPHFDPNANVFISGATRGGKTVTANHQHAEFSGLSIFFNSEEESNIVGFRVRSPKELLEGIKRVGWNGTFDYVPRAQTGDGLQDELNALQPLLFRLADMKNRDHPMQIVVDECQDYAPQGGAENGLHVLVRKGLKRNIKVVLLSQDPATVSKTVIRQCYYKVWCGGFDPYYQPYFDTYKLPTELIKSLSQGEYAVFTGATCVAQSKSPAKYA